MSRTLTLCLGVGLLTVATITAAPAVSAQEIDATSHGAARTLGYSGVEAYQRGDYRVASEKLEKSFKMLRVPSVGLWSARALEKLGLLVEAAERYREVGRLSLGRGDQAVQRQAQAEAEEELKALGPRVPSLEIIVQSASASARIALDGVELAPELIGEIVPVNPGVHLLTVKDGERSAQRQISVKEAERARVVLDLEQAQRASPAPAPAAPPRAAPASPADAADNGHSPGRSSALRTTGWVSLAVGGAALAFGATTGAMALAKKGTLDGDGCTDGRCFADQADDVGSYNSLRGLSTAGFIVGAVGAGAGAVILLTAPSSKQPSQGVAASIGLGRVAVTGRF